MNVRLPGEPRGGSTIISRVTKRRVLKRNFAAIVGLLVLQNLSPTMAAPPSSNLSTDNVNGAKSTSDASVIKIGYLLSQTGVGEKMSKAMLEGMNLYLDEIHHRMAGKTVELIVENDESNPATALAKFKELVVDKHVPLISGIFFSHIAYAIGTQLEKYKVPVVCAASAADDLTQRKRSPWLIRTSFAGSQPTQPFGEWVYKKLHYKKVACLAADYPFGYEVIGGFQRTFEEAGGKVIQKIWVPLGFSDFRPLIGSISKDADAVFLCTLANSADAVPRQFKELGIKIPLIGIGTGFEDSILAKIGDDVMGAVSTLPYCLTLKTPANQHFVNAYKAKYGTEPGWYVECGYTAGLWIDQAVESIHGEIDNKANLMAALKNVELKNDPRGPMKLDRFGNPIENIYVRRVERVNGKVQNTVIDTFPNVSQFWKTTPEEFLKQPVFSKTYPPCRYCQTESSSK